MQGAGFGPWRLRQTTLSLDDFVWQCVQVWGSDGRAAKGSGRECLFLIQGWISQPLYLMDGYRYPVDCGYPF